MFVQTLTSVITHHVSRAVRTPREATNVSVMMDMRSILKIRPNAKV